MPRDNTDARVGDLIFAPDFSDPFVDVDKAMNTVEKEMITDEYYVQAFGRKADKISIEGVIWQTQLSSADRMAERNQVPVRTERWTGMAIPEAVSTTYRNEADGKYGAWIYDIAIDLIELQQTIPEDAREDFLNSHLTADTPERDVPTGYASAIDSGISEDPSDDETDSVQELRENLAMNGVYGVGVTQDDLKPDADEDDDDNEILGDPSDDYDEDDLIQ